MARRVEPLDEAYFVWLCSLLDEDWEFSYDREMLRTMHRTPFRYTVSNDRNRALDGIELRHDFFYNNPVKSSPWEVDGWLGLECSILEMLIALADRAAYQSGDSMTRWFQVFLENLGLPDNVYRTKNALRRLNSRQYSWDGSGGGLFPLRYPGEDQRQVEIWYQMSAYIIENSDREGV